MIRVSANPANMFRAVIVAILVVASGCHLPQWARNGFKVGPNHEPTPALIAEDWIDHNDPRVLSDPPEHVEWWSVFNDPKVNELVETAYQQNLTLREAGMRVLQTRARRAMAAGNLFPQSQQAFGDYEHIQESGSVALPPPLRVFDQWSAGLNLSWELDVWGRFRRSLESADSDLDASVDEYDAILVCLIAEVVAAYVDIRTFEQRLKYARQNVQIQEKSHDLTETRAKAGKTGFISVYLSKSSLEATRATIPGLKTGLRQANNRLCTLLGEAPVNFAEQLGPGGIPTAPTKVAVGIPADLLRRRPDVRAAESQVASQSAQIGIAIADFYPSIAITGEISTQAEEFRNLFRPLSVGGSIGPSFSWNVLNYGRITNNVRFQDARFQELVANYQNTVLAANQEVEDALVAFLQTQQQVRSLAESSEATQRALELELLNFKEGESDFTGVFVLQGALTTQQDQLATAQGDVTQSLISVYKALGGGWEIRCRETAPHVVTEVEAGVDVESERDPDPQPEVEPKPERIPLPPPSPVELLFGWMTDDNR
jgi:NodT family efflux transporter outer membrane factor (OMF) lipoprotein